MHDDADAAQAGAAFETPENVVIEFESFFCNRQCELPGLQNEWLARL